MVKDAVLKFLEAQNRPFSTIDISQQLKQHTKGQIDKALASLVSHKKVIEKTYGKQKIYCIIQSSDSNTEKLNVELKEIDAKSLEVTRQLRSIENELKEVQVVLKAMKKQIRTEDAVQRCAVLKTKIGVMEEKLEVIRDGGEKLLSVEEKAELVKQHGIWTKEYRKRKRMCTEMVDAILDSGYPKKKKDLLEEVGVETDEDVGFMLSTNILVKK